MRQRTVTVSWLVSTNLRPDQILERQ